ncbi:MAG: cDP-diacylglycerol--glycerol-3-phosphate 3-phosphatidyltransferase [Chlamydiota bacterium]
MWTVSNILSLLRAPLALLFLTTGVSYRVLAILLAMLTDGFDGYLARKRGATTRLGAVLDPAMDKFFVVFALVVFFMEGKIELWEGCAMIARDFFLCVFGLYLSFSGVWESYKVTAIRWGKISTALQFIVLMVLTLGYSIPSYLYTVFIVLGLLAFIELWQLKQVMKQNCNE